jgi:thymidylate synthase
VNFHYITARDIPEAWAKLMGKILDEGEYRQTPRGAFAGSHKVELDLVVVEIEKPWLKPLLPIMPPGIPTETDEEHYLKFKAAMLRDCQYPEGYDYYGHFVEPQMLYAYEALFDKVNWDSNHFCIIAGDDRTLTCQQDPWIWKLLDLRIKGNSLHAIAYFRSLETWGAFPRFAAALQEGKAEIAENIGAEDGKLFIVSKATHLYDYSWEWAKGLAMRDKSKPTMVDDIKFGNTITFDDSSYQEPMSEQIKES